MHESSTSQPTKSLMVHTSLYISRCVLPQNEDDKNRIEMANDESRNDIQKNGTYHTAHCEDILTPCQRMLAN